MPRCYSCQKFASYEGDEEPEIVMEPEISDDGQFTMEVRIVKRCADCGDELKETTFLFEQDISEWVEGRRKENPGEEFEATVTSAEQTEESGGRYKKSYYGAAVSVQVACVHCDECIDLDFSDKCPASYMDDLTW